MNGWRKSSHSFANGNCTEVASWRKSAASCVDAAGNWRKSSRSEAGNCAEVGQGGAVVLVRDSQLAESPVLAFSAAAWTAFCRRLVR